MGGTLLRSSLAVWTIEPTSFWYDARATDRVAYDAVGRYTSPTASFRAQCDSSSSYGTGVYVSWTQPPSTRWELAFISPRGTPLRPGTYDVPAGFIELGQPHLRIAGTQYGCATGKARVVIEEYEYRTTGEVDRFVATIEQQQCVGVGVFRAEIRLTSPTLGDVLGPMPGRCAP